MCDGDEEEAKTWESLKATKAVPAVLRAKDAVFAMVRSATENKKGLIRTCESSEYRQRLVTGYGIPGFKS